MYRVRLALIAALVSVPSLAFAADSSGRAGVIRELDVNHTTGDTYLQYGGSVLIDNGISVDEYRWGGSSCSNQHLSEAKVALLQQAMQNGTLIQPRYKSGQGSNKCLVGFVLVAAP